LRKPSRLIFERALGIAQASAERVVFIDDREQNIVPAKQLGMNVIHYQSATQLSAELHELGVKFNHTGR
jgi:FMN phosphatase YigB (HAD superfamily)